MGGFAKRSRRSYAKPFVVLATIHASYRVIHAGGPSRSAWAKLFEAAASTWDWQEAYRICAQQLRVKSSAKQRVTPLVMQSRALHQMGNTAAELHSLRDAFSIVIDAPSDWTWPLLYKLICALERCG